MLWFALSVLSAFSDSLKNVFSKKTMRDIDEYSVSWAVRIFSLPFLVPLLFFAGIGVPPLGSGFWGALLIGGSLNAVTTILYMKAIKHSDLSLAIPMQSFTPLFLILTSPFMVGEFPTLTGLVGILLIVAGSYLLNIEERRAGFLGPFRALLRESGPRLMLVVAFIWSITSNFDKIGVQNSSPLFWAVATNTFLAVVLFPIMMYKSRKSVGMVSANAMSLVPIGFFSALTLLTQMTAINMALVAYVVSIKRTSGIISVVLGRLIFHEGGIKERLAGAAVMVAGVALIAFQ